MSTRDVVTSVLVDKQWAGAVLTNSAALTAFTTKDSPGFQQYIPDVYKTKAGIVDSGLAFHGDFPEANQSVHY